MTSDAEELAREGMRQFTATMHVSPDLAARTCQRHRRRARGKLAGLAAFAGAVAAGTVAAVTVLAPAGGQPRARPTAWTVAEQPNGTITVTIQQLTDPAGLQSTLRADGVPVSVTFSGQQNPACHPYRGVGAGRFRQIVDFGLGQANVMTIHKLALPGGAGLQIIAASPASPASPASQPRVRFIAGAGLVSASPQCTGS
jgi:hypothetical protein